MTEIGVCIKCVIVYVIWSGIEEIHHFKFIGNLGMN